MTNVINYCEDDHGAVYVFDSTMSFVSCEDMKDYYEGLGIGAFVFFQQPCDDHPYFNQ